MKLETQINDIVLCKISIAIIILGSNNINNIKSTIDDDFFYNSEQMNIKNEGNNKIILLNQNEMNNNIFDYNETLDIYYEYHEMDLSNMPGLLKYTAIKINEIIKNLSKDEESDILSKDEESDILFISF